MLLDSSVRRELLGDFWATLAVLLSVELVAMLVRTLGLVTHGEAAPQDLALLLGYTALAHLATTLSLSLFVAVMATLGRMHRDNEMAVWLTTGVGLWRFVRPVLLAGAPVLVTVGVLVLVVRPWGNLQGLELREHFQQRSDLVRAVPGEFQVLHGGSRVVFAELSAPGEGSRVNHVFSLSDDGGRETVVSAQSGRMTAEGGQRVLLLEHGQRSETVNATGERSLTRFEHYRLLFDEQPAPHARELRPATLPTPVLLRRPQPAYRGELAWRLGLLLGAFNLLLLGVGLPATVLRRQRSGWLLFALLAFVTYYNAINVSQAWVSGGRLGMAWALLGLHGPVFALALALLQRRAAARA